MNAADRRCTRRTAHHDEHMAVGGSAGERHRAHAVPVPVRSSLQVPERVLQAGDARAALRAVLRSWLPLSEAVLGMATQHMPSPVAAAPSRVPRLLIEHPLAADVPAEVSEALQVC